MPLRDILMNDDAARDHLAETRRELHNAYERIEELEMVVRGMLELTRLLSKNREIPQHIRELLTTHHRVIDAMELLR